MANWHPDYEKTKALEIVNNVIRRADDGTDREALTIRQSPGGDWALSKPGLLAAFAGKMLVVLVDQDDRVVNFTADAGALLAKIDEWSDCGNGKFVWLDSQFNLASSFPSRPMVL